MPFRTFGNFLRRNTRKRIGVLVDGPNMLRKEFDFDFNKIKQELHQFGDIRIARVFLNQFAPGKLIEAVTNQGFQPIMITTGDVDAPMAAEAMEIVYNNNIDMLCLMTRDSDFQPVLQKAKAHGKETIVIGGKPFSVALKNTADHIIMLKDLSK